MARQWIWEGKSSALSQADHPFTKLWCYSGDRGRWIFPAERISGTFDLLCTAALMILASIHDAVLPGSEPYESGWLSIRLDRGICGSTLPFGMKVNHDDVSTLCAEVC